MKTSISVLLLGLFTGACGPSLAQTGSRCPQLIHGSAQLNSSYCDSSIKRIHPAGNSVRIKQQDGSIRYADAGQFWGIRKRDGTLLRFYLGKWYEANSLEPFMQYSQGHGRHTCRFFSTAPDSAILPYETAILKRHLDSSVYNKLERDRKRMGHEMALAFYGTAIRLLGTNLLGGGMDISYRPAPKWRTGIALQLAGRRNTDSFSLPASRPLLNYAEIGWLNSFTVLSSKKVMAEIGVTNGWAYTELRDRAQTERVHSRYGDRDSPKKVASNSLYLLQPHAAMSLKLTSFRDGPDVLLMTRAQYRLLLGNRSFGNYETGPGLVVNVGISLSGLDR